jgi:hypothetical protein
MVALQVLYAVIVVAAKSHNDRGRDGGALVLPDMILPDEEPMAVEDDSLIMVATSTSARDY